MTELEALREQLQLACAAAGVSWAVAVAPPPGHVGPCVAIARWEERPSLTSSVTDYPIVSVDCEISGLQEHDMPVARRVVRALADADWASDMMVALHGRVSRFVYERSPHARQQHWTAIATIEYEVVLTEEL